MTGDTADASQTNPLTFYNQEKLVHFRYVQTG